MSEQKRYTAQEMREMAFKVQPAPNMPDREYKRMSKVEAMLRQSADAEEELATLKARMESVVKECEKWKWADDSWLTDVNESILAHNRCVERIIKSARGDEVSK